LCLPLFFVVSLGFWVFFCFPTVFNFRFTGLQSNA
jgi:hypothetical protein